MPHPTKKPWLRFPKGGWTQDQALFIGKEYQRGGGLGGSHKGAAYSNLSFPKPNFGSRFFWGVGGSQSQKKPPLLLNKGLLRTGGCTKKKIVIPESTKTSTFLHLEGAMGLGCVGLQKEQPLPRGQGREGGCRGTARSTTPCICSYPPRLSAQLPTDTRAFSPAFLPLALSGAASPPPYRPAPPPSTSSSEAPPNRLSPFSLLWGGQQRDGDKVLCTIMAAWEWPAQAIRLEALGQALGTPFASGLIDAINTSAGSLREFLQAHADVFLMDCRSMGVARAR